MKKESTPKPKVEPKPQSSKFMLSDKEVKDNEQAAGYPIGGAFGIGISKGK